MPPLFSNMAALATILNPLAPHKEQLWTFSNNGDGDLVLMRGENLLKPAAVAFHQVSRQQTSFIRNPSSIVALYYQSMINVYAYSGENTLMRLSPMLEQVGAPNTVMDGVGSLAGIVSPSGESAWLYYVSAGIGPSFTLSELAIDSTDPSVHVSGLILRDTYLAAAYYKYQGLDERRLFFQANDFLRMVKMNTQEDGPLKDTGNARNNPPTPLAACTAPNQNDILITYLYYVDRDDTLYRATLGQFLSSVAPVENAPKMASWSQIAVTAGATHNYVSYATKSGDNLPVTIWADLR
ncbi:hypothetical protein K505DRAFT_368521 [Melanomma pulvis-pyrius CBS 109.77]|uniref:Fucose-specific lectin n=1 Tax=Melanomma pulvis-pyrius CBS 109.77 TaxID=1314802 RepID=A0A6A6WPR5_9PLEO|nr:hypothetical protein K505DRAFT_368521 [Melanomma pulvis-pyrius CBS 109.77]